jgi:drug/metabolite transporter (DMT)-like permease
MSSNIDIKTKENDMPQTGPPNSRFQDRVRKSTLRLAYCTGVWLITTALLAFGPEFVWNESVPLTYGAFALNLLAGVAMIVANRNYIRDLDELHRKIMLDAMGITLGVAVVVSLAYSLLENYDLVPFRADAAHLSILMSLTFMACVFLGMRRYR